VAESMSLAVTGTLAVPLGENWPLPLIDVVDAAAGEHFLSLPASLEWTPESGTAIAFAAAPGWVTAASNAAPATAPRLYRARSSQWMLEHRPAPADAGPLRVDSVWTRIWQRGGSREHGTTI